MTPVIDLRRFARAGERSVLVRLDGRELRATFSHVSTEWATVDVPHAAVAVSDHVRAALFRDGARLAVTFEVLGVRDGSAEDSAELTVVAAAVLGERPIRAPAAVGEGEALAIRVGRDDHVERVPVRIVDVAAGGIGIEGADAFVPGDEITIVREGREAFRVRVRVVRRTAGRDGAARFGCRLVAATADDEERLRSLAAT
jgi:PilZ domain